jgi:DNA gyrase subunit A
MVNIMEVVDSDDLIVITNTGVLMRQPVSAIRTIGRVTQGVKLVKLDEGTTISSITRVMHEDETTKEKENQENETHNKEDAIESE